MGGFGRGEGLLVAHAGLRVGGSEARRDVVSREDVLSFFFDVARAGEIAKDAACQKVSFITMSFS